MMAHHAHQLAPEEAAHDHCGPRAQDSADPFPLCVLLSLTLSYQDVSSTKAHTFLAENIAP
jgi:hypothetical protein